MKSRILTREDVEKAIKQTNSNNQAAEFYGISKRAWKRYASMYTDKDGVTLYEKHNNRYRLGIPNKNKNEKPKPTIFDVLSGKIPASLFKPRELKAMVIHEGILEERCSCCGFSEERITDHKVPLLMTFRNQNKKDWKIDNLQLLCYNCYFLQVGDVLTESQMNVIQGIMIPKKEDIQDILDLSSVDMTRLEQIWKGEHSTQDLSGDDLISRK